MSISTVKYRETFPPKPDLTRIIGIPTYDAKYQMRLELKINALSLHYNIGGATQRHLGILITNTKYATMSPVPYVGPVHTGILLIPKNATCVASYELKQLYDENIQIFHERHGFKQALMQQVATYFNKK